MLRLAAMRIAVSLALVLGCAGSPPPVAPAAPAPVKAVEPSEPPGMPAGYIEMHPDRVVTLDGGGAVVLVDQATNLALPIFIGGTEALSIGVRLRGEHAVRPLTHDLLDHLLHELHGTLIKVQVDELRDQDTGGVFIGSIYVRANGRVFKVDARPSDAIALAIGNRVPIYVARAVLDRAGVRWDDLQQQLTAHAAGEETG